MNEGSQRVRWVISLDMASLYSVWLRLSGAWRRLASLSKGTFLGPGYAHRTLFEYAMEAIVKAPDDVVKKSLGRWVKLKTILKGYLVGNVATLFYSDRTTTRHFYSWRDYEVFVSSLSKFKHDQYQDPSWLRVMVNKVKYNTLTDVPFVVYARGTRSYTIANPLPGSLSPD